MNIAILDYSTGNVDLRILPKNLENEVCEVVEDYLYNVLGYKESQIYYMYGKNIRVHFINKEDEDEF